MRSVNIIPKLGRRYESAFVAASPVSSALRACFAARYQPRELVQNILRVRNGSRTPPPSTPQPTLRYSVTIQVQMSPSYDGLRKIMEPRKRPAETEQRRVLRRSSKPRQRRTRRRSIRTGRRCRQTQFQVLLCSTIRLSRSCRVVDGTRCHTQLSPSHSSPSLFCVRIELLLHHMHFLKATLPSPVNSS